MFLGTRIVVLSQYYSDGRGQDVQRGAKIVADYQVKKNASTTESKETANFGKLIGKIRKEGFDPQQRIHVTDFNLQHPDSFQSLTDIEKQKA